MWVFLKKYELKLGGPGTELVNRLMSKKVLVLGRQTRHRWWKTWRSIPQPPRPIITQTAILRNQKIYKKMLHSVKFWLVPTKFVRMLAMIIFSAQNIFSKSCSVYLLKIYIESRSKNTHGDSSINKGKTKKTQFTCRFYVKHFVLFLFFLKTHDITAKTGLSKIGVVL